MSLKTIFYNFFKICLIMLLFCPAAAQYKRISRFKGVVIPFNLKYEDSFIEKGTYDLELLKHQTQQVFYLRIKKRRKTLCNVTGEKLKYESFGDAGLFNDQNIPDEPRIKFKRNPVKKIFSIIFESGKKNPVYPYIKLRFSLEYEE